MKNACITCNKCRITTTFGTKIAHDKPFSYAKENFEISTDVRDNVIIVLKFDHFHRKALNFERLYLSCLWMKPFKIW